MASGVKIGFCASSTLRLLKRVFCKLGMSVLLSASDGTLIGRTLILKNKSALNSPFSTFFSRSLCVAQINLKSILMSCAPPTLCIVLLSIALKSFAWRGKGISPISSRKSDPPLDCSNLPFLCLSAPVNDPFSCPKSSDSNNSDGIAAQFTVMKGPFLFEHLWIAWATISLPVPVSPKIKAVLSAWETIAIKFFIDFVSGLSPSIILLSLSNVDWFCSNVLVDLSTTFIKITVKILKDWY